MEEYAVLQAYLNFAQTLVDCKTIEDASEKLQANPVFMDHRMMFLLYEIANQVEETHRKFLYDIAFIIRQEVEKLMNCFFQGLQLSAESDFNPQVVHSFLEANQDLWNERLYDALEGFKPQYYSDDNPDNHVGLALATAYYSRLIHQSPHGSKALNVKIASLGFEIAMEVLTQENCPQDWDVIQGYVDDVLDEL